MAIWSLKIGIWKLQLVILKLKMIIWKLKLAIWKLKNEHLEAKNGQKCLNAGFGPQIFQNDGPKFLVKFFMWR